MQLVKDGDLVRIHYTGKLEDGTVFDTSRDREPLEFHAGSHELISGVSQAVLGMSAGESKTVTVPPDEGYGPRREGLAQRVPREAIPEETRVGDALNLKTGQGNLVLWVMDMDDTHAVLDPNHPLAGKTLVFDIELVSVGNAVS